MMEDIRFGKTVLGKQITATLLDTGAGISVLIEGGDKGHIGAVAIKQPGKELISHQFETHREGIVAERWADALCSCLGQPVVVSAGVHYDNITKEQIEIVLNGLEEMLQEIMKC